MLATVSTACYSNTMMNEQVINTAVNTFDKDIVNKFVNDVNIKINDAFFIFIDRCKIALANKEIARLKRKAEKKNFDMPVIFQSQFVTAKINGNIFEGAWFAFQKYSFVSEKGWSPVCFIEHADSGNVIFEINEGDTGNLYAKIAPNCEHCNQKRNRHQTWILENSGNRIQVGSTCLNDFGGNSLMSCIGQFEIVSELIEKLESFELSESLGSSDEVSNMELFLSRIICMNEKWPFMGTTKANEIGAHSTVDRYRNGDYEHLNITDLHKEKASEVFNWAINISDGEAEVSSYLGNLRTIANRGMITRRTIGFAASMPTAKQNADLRKIAEDKNSLSNYMGNIGDQIVVKVMVEKVIPFETQFGYSYVNLMRSEGGNVLVWISSNSLTEGFMTDISGTVKEHNERDNVKQTILTRCFEVVYTQWEVKKGNDTHLITALSEKDMKDQVRSIFNIKRITKDICIKEIKN